MYCKTRFRRYHSLVWLPENIRQLTQQFYDQLPITLQMTAHAKDQFDNDPLGTVPFPCMSDLMMPTNTLVEAQEILTTNRKPSGLLQKIVVRCHHLHCKIDYTYVVVNDGYLVSGWSNEKTDHPRLTHSDGAYYKPKTPCELKP